MLYVWSKKKSSRKIHSSNIDCLFSWAIFTYTSSFKTEKVSCHLLIIKYVWANFALASMTDEDGCALGHPAVHWRQKQTHIHLFWWFGCKARSLLLSRKRVSGSKIPVHCRYSIQALISWVHSLYLPSTYCTATN